MKTGWLRIRVEGGHPHYFLKGEVEATSILRRRDLMYNPLLLDNITGNARVQVDALSWTVGRAFNAEKGFEYAEFDHFLSSLLRDTESEPVRVALAAPFIIDASFRAMVEGLFHLLLNAGTDPSNQSPQMEEVPTDAQRKDEQASEQFGHFT